MQAFFNRKLYWQPISLHSILNNFTFLLNLCYFMVWENVSCWPETWVKFLTSHFQFIESFLWHFLYSTLFYLRVRLVRRCMVLCTWLSHPQLSDLICRQKLRPINKNTQVSRPTIDRTALRLHNMAQYMLFWDRSCVTFALTVDIPLVWNRQGIWFATWGGRRITPLWEVWLDNAKLTWSPVAYGWWCNNISFDGIISYHPSPSSVHRATPGGFSL